MDTKAAIQWYTSGESRDISSQISVTRDVFRERLRKFRSELEKLAVSFGSTALVTAVCGEIGNNAFDHNLGKWQDQPGCWFQYEIQGPLLSVALADRGQGFLESLRPTFPEVQSAEQALKFAFERRASGRAPERRGNGLKFVKAQIGAQMNSSLIAFSDGASYEIGEKFKFEFPQPKGHGVFILIRWKL